MPNWFWKLLGYHVCEEFGAWYDVKIVTHLTLICGWTGTPINPDNPLVTERHHCERKCKTCGKIERARYEYD